MRLILIIVFIMFSPNAYSYELSDMDMKTKNELVKIWKSYLVAAEKKDIKQLKKMSLEKIRCYNCLENTKNEYSALKKLRYTEKNWYEKLYNEMIFIPNEIFYSKDFPIFFTNEFIKKLKVNEVNYNFVKIKNETIYEVLVTTTQPGVVSKEHEGGQHAFQFVIVNKNFKFFGIDTIP
jgi:hypothetical protein